MCEEHLRAEGLEGFAQVTQLFVSLHIFYDGI